MRAVVKVDPGAPRRGYWANLGEAVSQALAAIFWLDCNLTLSAHCGRWHMEGTPVLRHLRHIPNFVMSIPRIVRGLGIDHNHCLNAWNALT